MTNSVLNVLKVFGLSGIAFVVGVSLTPILTHYLYKYKLWRKEVRQLAPDGRGTPIFAKLHKERETKVPRMGGILIWGVLLFLIYLFYFLSLTGSPFFLKFNFFFPSHTFLSLVLFSAREARYLYPVFREHFFGLAIYSIFYFSNAGHFFRKRYRRHRRPFRRCDGCDFWGLCWNSLFPKPN